jgi:hypothetical protein
LRLPDSNDLVLPEEHDLCLDRNDQILATLDDALNLLPAWAREPDSDVRDAMLEAWREMANFIQAKTGHLLGAVATPRHAEGLWLAEWGETYHRPKAAGESEGQYRARLLDQGDVVSPNAIKAAVDALVAEYSPIPPVYQEPATDAIFWAPIEGPWTAFWQPTTVRLWAVYPDNINPTVGAYWVPDVQYALFWIILPGDQSAGELHAYYQLDDAGDAGTQWPTLAFDPSFIMPPGEELGYVFDSDTPLLEQVRSTVEPIRGAGVIWAAYGDFGIAGAR